MRQGAGRREAGVRTQQPLGDNQARAGTAGNTEGGRPGNTQDAFAAFNPTEPNGEIGFE